MRTTRQVCGFATPRLGKLTPHAVSLLISILLLTGIPGAAQQIGDPATPVSGTDQPEARTTVDRMLAEAEAQCARGRAAYAAGHLQDAKEAFNDAFNLLLSGPVSVRSDPRLISEFHKVVSGTYALELQALKQGDGFTERSTEPAPIDEANSLTFPVDPNIKAQAEQEVKHSHTHLPLTLNDAVASYISYFSTKGRDVLQRALVRAGLYRKMIQKTLRKEGLPQELMYLALAESGFHPLALSRVGARGMWQFMPGSAANYGLKRNWWLDERQDPEKSTQAAASFLKDLYEQFGDWYLAMAAYNSGPGTVQRAVQRTGYADFWELYRRKVLPRETRNYVPIILAVTIMAENPDQYGLSDLVPEDTLVFDRVKVRRPVDLRVAAECAGTSVATLRQLNPSLLRYTTPGNSSFALRIPPGTEENFEKAIAALPPQKRVLWNYHRVRGGETLSELAWKYHTTVRAIAQANNLRGYNIRLGRRLMIPIGPERSHNVRMARSSRVRTSARRSLQVIRHRARKGESLASIALKYNTTVSELRRDNPGVGKFLIAGHELLIKRTSAK